MTLFKNQVTNVTDLNRYILQLLKQVPLYYDENRIWYKWNFQFNKWEIIDEVDILIAVQKETSITNMCKPHIISQIVNTLKMEARKNKPTELTKYHVQFSDVIINLKTGVEVKASPSYFTFNPIPWRIGNSEDTPTIEALFTDWVGKERVLQLYQWLAYQLLPSYPIHRVMILNGSGSNGKSTFLTLLRKFIGDHNYVAGDFESVFCRRFGTSVLYKKLSVIMPEAEFSKIEKTATFKSATGDDPLFIEFKNKGAFTFINYAKVTISTNSLPITLDKTDAFYRRVMVVDFPNKFAERFDLLSTIPSYEYNNLARKCLRLLFNLLSQGKFHNEDSIDDKRLKYEKLSNPLSVFLEENTIESGDECIHKSDFFIEANKWLKNRGYRALTNKEINKIMKETFQEGWGMVYEEGNRRSQRAWMGIMWKRNQIKIKEEDINETETEV